MKYVSTIIIAIVAFAAGFIAHLKMADANLGEVSGDINRVGQHFEILDPEEESVLLASRMQEYAFLTNWIDEYASTLQNEKLDEALKVMKKVQKQSVKSVADPKEAFKLLGEQSRACDTFVTEADAVLAGSETKDVKLASLRDLMVSFCVQNSYLMGDEDLIGYWASLPEQVASEDMAYKFSE